ncbi:hypothetical protein RA8P2_00174 (plasmid) [Variovorax sp. RA8]|nr:hypothetical protein RA8P2_00174 [Variovorax sp. RA8]
MSAPYDLVFLFDVDNTLLDNDRVVSALGDHFEQAFGSASADRCWSIFEQLRSEFGYADYLGALQRNRVPGDGLVQRVDVPQVQLEHEAVVRTDAPAQRLQQLGAAGLDAANAADQALGVVVAIDDGLQHRARSCPGCR